MKNKINVWETFTNQKQWEIYLKDLLQRNNKALIKALLLIYDRQTEEEKHISESIQDNSIGFNKYDTYILTYYAKSILEGGLLSPEDVYVIRAKMPKYWKQLMNISKQQQEEKKRKLEEYKQFTVYDYIKEK